MAFQESSDLAKRTASIGDRPLRRAERLNDSIAAGLLNLVDQAIFIVDSRGIILDLNESGAAVAGAPAAQLVGRKLAAALPLRERSTGDSVFPLSATAVPGSIMAYLERQRGEFRLDWRKVACEQGEITVLSLVDETPGRALQQALRTRETIDPITRVLNREQFEARIDVALATCRDRPDVSHVVCHLDIDHFRLINDAIGPEAGDRLLWELAGTIASAVGGSDAVGRIGDNAFGVIFDDIDMANARRRAEHVARAIAARGFEWQGRAFDITTSAGLVAVTWRSSPGAELLRQAGAACRQAKQEGRGNIVVSDDTRRASLHIRQLATAGSIKEALATGRVSLAGQDIVRTSGPSAARHFELLLRVSDARGRITPAGHLIAAAERFDLMRSIDRWVLDEALERLGEQVAAVPQLSISINLSGSSLGDPGFLPYLLGIIARSPVEPTALTFELTETAVMRQAEAARRTIDVLRATGCRIALDDFGVGLSNFDYLQRFPVDVVKIDGSFVRHMLVRPRDAAIVEAIIALAHRLGAQTVVEHVESAALLARARALGADFAQGYHVGRPRPFETILEELVFDGVTMRGGTALPVTRGWQPVPR